METNWSSHPWINFQLDLKGLPPSLWMKLGEARSKCEHLKGVPLRPEISLQLHMIYLAKGVHATTAIEGNTLSENDVLEIIQQRDTTPESQAYLKREVDNVLRAANIILDNVEQVGATPITLDDITGYNKSVLSGLEVEEYVTPGEITRVQVGVPRYKGLPPEHCEAALIKLCDWLNHNFKARDEDETLVIGLIKAIVAHVYLVWIHPFGDGNGRTARLLEVRFLLEAGLPSAAGHLLSNHYNMTRAEYYRQLDRASKSGGNLCPFIEYAISGFVDQIREQLQMVKKQQWNVTWTNYIHEKFSDGTSPMMKRQRKLALAISQHDAPIERKRIRRISADIAEEYANCAEKTISRDLNVLVKMGLIEKVDRTFRAKKETVLQFLPRARHGDIEAQMEEAKRLADTSSNQLALRLPPIVHPARRLNA